MKTLVVLGNYEAALEVEIQAEQFFTKITRDDVLIRLRSCYLEQDLASVKDNHNFTRRRESRRRAAITRLLEVASLPLIKTQRPMSDTGSESSTSTDPSLQTLTPPSSTSSSPSPSFLSEKSIDVPDEIMVTNPDTWDDRQMTFSESMHTALEILPIP